MRYGLYAASAALMLAACGGGATDVEADADGNGTVSSDEMNAAMSAVGDDIKPEPGKYKATMTFVKADIPGAPPQMQEMMGSAMNQTHEFCLTPEEAEKGFEESMTEGQDGCEISKFNIDGNDLDMAMTCSPNGNDGAMNMTMKGNVTPTRSEMQMTMSGNMQGLGEANIEMEMVQERIGDCDA
ncbi:MAG: DUF3617 domain-containing protein [Pseudomonadota bacterium]